MSVDDHMDRLTVAHHAIITAWTDIETRGYLKEHPDLILHDLNLLEAALREVRAAAEQEKPGWGELQADPHEDFEERVADYQAHSCDCDHCFHQGADPVPGFIDEVITPALKHEKTPCVRCRRPQWNADGNPHCHDCRTS